MDRLTSTGLAINLHDDKYFALRKTQGVLGRPQSKLPAASQVHQWRGFLMFNDQHQAMNGTRVAKVAGLSSKACQQRKFTEAARQLWATKHYLPRR